jgi:acyl-CoA synthetase (AMP-forming)/AMP-acid ligase II
VAGRTQRELNVIQTIDLEEKYGSVGKPLPGVTIKIVDGEGKELPAGMVGTICVKTGPGAPFLEYWEDPGLTSRHLQDGWFHTPARGRLDDDGALWIGSSPSGCNRGQPPYNAPFAASRYP